MIVKMSKYAFMVYHREYDTFLAQLRELGVVHVKENKSILDNAELQDILAIRKRVNLLTGQESWNEAGTENRRIAG